MIRALIMLVVAFFTAWGCRVGWHAFPTATDGERWWAALMLTALSGVVLFIAWSLTEDVDG